MENVAISRRNHTNKKGNKENAQPEHGAKSFTRREKPSVPFQVANHKKEAKNVPLKAKVDTRSVSAEPLKKVKPVQKGAADVPLRQTHSRAFLSEQAARHKKIVAEAPKPPAAAPPSTKSALGVYKGKIVQSKIGSIWKSATTVGGADLKPPAARAEGQKVVTKSRSKSVADLSRVAQKPAQVRSKSVSDRPTQVSKPAVPTRRPAGVSSARPSARNVPLTLTSTSTRNTKVAPTKRSGIQTQKPKIQVTEKKVYKPPVASARSQYSVTMETAEERRAKLAEWLASKGKTFKRPAMTTAEPSKTKVPVKPAADPRPNVESRQPEPRLEAQKPEFTTRQTHSRTPVIMNTSLDLLENSDDCLPVDQQDSVDDIVVNLCDALEAMETPSRCDGDLHNDGEMEESKVKDDCKEEEEVKKETPEDVSEQPKVEQVTDGEEESDDDDVMETTPQMEGASVIKYSVKTTPYLQSVKKTISDEASLSTSRRKSNIKDLKFLTPVRRSCRIQRKSSRLPTMLADHDPCVSSLAELVKLDDDANAYIYRKNDALLHDLPDQAEL